MSVAEQASQRVLIEQIGSACVTIAQQAGAVAELQQQLAQAHARIAELEKNAPPAAPVAADA